MRISRSSIFASLLTAVIITAVYPIISFAGSWNGWIYQNPYPTSKALRSVRFITPQKGWIAGEEGTILYTENGGDTWAYQESGTKQWIVGLYFANERQGWAVGAGNPNEKGVILHTENGGQAWVPQDGDFYSNLNSVYFLNDKEGWIAGGGGVLLHTTDSGRKWQQIKILGLTGGVASVYFIDTQTGWVLTGNEIYHTTDGGQTWDSSQLDIKNATRMGGEIYFTDKKRGWAVTGDPIIFSTEDGGKTWKDQFNYASVTYDSLMSISFGDDKRGCAIGSRAIICTEDGGKTWKEQWGAQHGNSVKINNFKFELLGINLISPTMGWVVGSYGQIMKTEDGGQSWKTTTPNSECGNQVFFINKKTGWLHGWGTPFICKTEDGGQTWQKQDAGINVNSVFFVNETTGWVAGAIEQRTKGHVTKAWGAISRTLNGGKTWETQSKEIMGGNNDQYKGGLNNVFFLNNRTGWVVGQKGSIFYTEDGGEHWKRQRRSNSELQLRAVQFVDSKTGWIAGIKSPEAGGWNGIVLHTTDGGHSWQEQHPNDDTGMESLYFTDKNNGWVTGKSEWGEFSSIYRTSDGGKTWKEAGPGVVGSLLLAFRNSQGIVISNKGWFLITKDGGTTWNQARIPLSKGPRYFDELLGNPR